MLIKEEIPSSRWRGLEESAEDQKAGKERLWILVNTGSLRLAVLNIYLACISTRMRKSEIDKLFPF